MNKSNKILTLGITFFVVILGCNGPHRIQPEELERLKREYEQRRQEELRQLALREAREKYLQSLLDGSYDVALCSRYWADGVGNQIDLEVKRRLETASKDLFSVHLCKHNSGDWQLTELTPATVKNALQQSVVIFGNVDKTQDGYTISVRAYSERGEFLSQPISTKAKIEAEIDYKYYDLVRQAFPFVGVIIDQKENQITIVLKGSKKLQKGDLNNFPKEIILIDTDPQKTLEVVDDSLYDHRIIAKIDETDLSDVASDAHVLMFGYRLGDVDWITLTLIDQNGFPCIAYQVFASTQKDITDGDYVGLTSASGQIELKHKNTQTLYVLVKKGREIASFQIPRGADPNYKHQITIPR